MKKFFSVLLALVLVLALTGCGASQDASSGAESTSAAGEAVSEEPSSEAAEASGSESASAFITVTVVNAGEVEVARQELSVDDLNGDGVCSIDEGLQAAHEKFYEGSNGYESAEGEYGLYITKLWGVENGGAFGYYVDDQMAMSLDDPLSEGNYLVAYVFADTANYSDMYTWFDVQTDGDKVTLTLSGYSFDASGAPVASAVEGISILVDGEDSGLVTDANGQVTLDLGEGANHLIEASGDGKSIVPAVIYY
ncbi:MAG: hypothetical protein IJS22_03810 [Lachnospiraceae bacterium]|nr:hypothetical protein [Lachnospiraceae bacterium]